jgi:hypothetical protein
MRVATISQGNWKESKSETKGGSKQIEVTLQ